MSSLPGSSLPPPSKRPAARLPTQAELDRQYLHTSFQPLVSALDQAIDDGDAARVKDELDAGPPRPNTEETLESAFERAVASGRVDIVGLLIDHGVSIRSTDLETAAKHGHLLVLALLMKLSHWPVDEVLDSGRTVLTVAAKHEGMVRWLLAQGASVNREDGYGETPLSCAVKADAQEVIKMLLDSGADVTRGAPLHASLLQREGGVNLRLMGQLLELGAPVNKSQGEGSPLWHTAGFEHVTALHVACDGSHRNLAAVRLLLAYGADPMLNRRLRGVSVPHTSPLDSATGRGYADIVSVIREHVSGDGCGRRSGAVKI